MKSTSIKIIPWVVAVAMFMETLDSTIINTALPTMAQSFHVNVIELKIALTSYLLSLAIFIPISGWIADKLGTKKVFLFAVVFFTLSSVLCGLSQNLDMLIIARILQGIGGAMMTPVGRLIILKTFPKSELLKAMNYVTIPGLLGPMLGPTVGGFITTFFSWRWIFFVNVPFGIAGVFLIIAYIQDYKADISPKFDTFGFIIIALAFVALLIAVESIGEPFFSPMMITMIFIFALLLCVLYFFYQKNRSHAVFDLKLFKIKTFNIAVAGSIVARLGVGGTTFLLPLLFQVGFGLSPFHAGLLISPIFIGMLSTKFFSRWLLKTYGFKKILILNPLMIGLTLISFSVIHSTTPHLIIIILAFIYGLFVSMQFSSMNALNYVDISPPSMSQASSIASTMMQLSSCFSVAITALMIKYFVGFQGLMPHDVSPLHNAFIATGFITMLSIFWFVRLSDSDGAAVSGR